MSDILLIDAVAPFPAITGNTQQLAGLVLKGGASSKSLLSLLSMSGLPRRWANRESS